MDDRRESADPLSGPFMLSKQIGAGSMTESKLHLVIGG
jgi:hypothetical protein